MLVATKLLVRVCVCVCVCVPQLVLHRWLHDDAIKQIQFYMRIIQYLFLQEKYKFGAFEKKF